jgi:hypothetical protein
VKNLVLLLKGFYPRFFALKNRAQNDRNLKQILRRLRLLRMTFFVVVLSASPVDILSAMKALVLLCRPEQREGPGFACHSERRKNLVLLLKGFYPIFALKKQVSE